MNKIKSFQVDHRKLGVGIYVSRVDVDIVTYDLRFCKPNSGTVLDNVTMHTIEHMLATFVRNSDIKNEVLYFAYGLSNRFLLACTRCGSERKSS